MIIPDINLLVYAYDPEASRHNSARQWWEGLVNGSEPVGLPWAVIVGFVRLVTNASAVSHPMTPQRAIDHVEEWLSYSHIAPLDPGPQHLANFRRALALTGTGRNRVPDAHIAALALEHGAAVHSNDSDFGRFPGLRRRNPL
ncbi:MAG: PIN domain-containing protein [Chloroflexota bacterium]|nr:PIN domain-containing protein [Chloroflexota bacterium]MDE2969674.1 PIN domain-containing protein [Chloroflexota bacterium]